MHLPLIFANSGSPTRSRSGGPSWRAEPPATARSIKRGTEAARAKNEEIQQNLCNIQVSYFSVHCLAAFAADFGEIPTGYYTSTSIQQIPARDSNREGAWNKLNDF